MQNRLPDNRGALKTLGLDMADGAERHGAGLNLVHHTGATLTVKNNKFTLASTAVGVAESATGDAVIAQRLADSNSKGFIATARDYLKRRLGKTWSAAWSAVGFTSHSLAVPGKLGDRINLLEKISNYFIANPTFEINSPNLVVTGVLANDLFNVSRTARKDVDDALEREAAAHRALDTAEKELRAEMERDDQGTGRFAGRG
jgi:hypothetical protein